jgi:hypothetical protein
MEFGSRASWATARRSRRSLGNVAQSSIVIVPGIRWRAEARHRRQLRNLSPVWRPDGTLLFLSNRDGGRDVYAVRLKSDGSAALPRAGSPPTQRHLYVATANGTRLVYAGFFRKSNIWTLPIPSRGVTDLVSGEGCHDRNQVIDMFDISPTATRLLSRRIGGPLPGLRMPLDGSAEPTW